jgi:MFS superfamily sulfate permease-like transporter
MDGASVRADSVAGVTVALVLIPQSMAYAQLAGMPAYHGLHTAFLPVIVGALWWSSRQLATGPVAMISLLTGSVLAPLAAVGSEHYVVLAIALTFLVGCIQFGLGVFRLGLIINFLSHPVVSAFTTAAAIIASVLVSLLLYLNRTSRPSIRSLVPDAADPSRKFRERAAGMPECPRLKILRIDGSLYFGAVNHVSEYLRHLAEQKPRQKHLLLMGKSMNFVDIAGAELIVAEARRQTVLLRPARRSGAHAGRGSIPPGHRRGRLFRHQA